MTAVSFSGSSYFQLRKCYDQHREEQITNTLTEAFKLNASDIATAQTRLKTASNISKTTFREKCTRVFLSCVRVAVKIGYGIIHPIKTFEKMFEKMTEPSSSGSSNSADPLKTIQNPTDLTKQVKALKELSKGQEKTNKKVEIAKNMGRVLLAGARELLFRDIRSNASIQDPKTLKALASAMVVDLIANAKLTEGTEIREAIQIGHFALCYALIEQIGNSEDPEEVFNLLTQLKKEATEVANRYGGKDPERRRLIFEKIYTPLQTGTPRTNLNQIYKNYLAKAAIFPEIAGRVYDYDTLRLIETTPPTDREGIALIKKRLDPRRRDRAFEEFCQEKEKEAQEAMDLCLKIEQLVDPDFSKGKCTLRKPEKLQTRIEDISLTEDEIRKASVIDTSKMNKLLQPICTKLQSLADRRIPSLTAEDFSLGKLKKEEDFSKGYTNLWTNFPVLNKLFPQHGPEQARQRREKMFKDLVGEGDLGLSATQIHAKPKKARSSVKNTSFFPSSDEESPIEPRRKSSSSVQRLKLPASSLQGSGSDSEDSSSDLDEFSTDSEVPEVDVLGGE